MVPGQQAVVELSKRTGERGQLTLFPLQSHLQYTSKEKYTI